MLLRGGAFAASAVRGCATRLRWQVAHPPSLGCAAETRGSLLGGARVASAVRD